MIAKSHLTHFQDSAIKGRCCLLSGTFKPQGQTGRRKRNSALPTETENYNCNNCNCYLNRANIEILNSLLAFRREPSRILLKNEPNLHCGFCSLPCPQEHVWGWVNNLDDCVTVFFLPSISVCRTLFLFCAGCNSFHFLTAGMSLRGLGVEPRCRCIETESRRIGKLIESLELFPPTPHCEDTEIMWVSAFSAFP